MAMLGYLRMEGCLLSGRMLPTFGLNVAYYRELFYECI